MVKPLTLEGKWRAVKSFTKDENALYRKIPISIKFKNNDIFYLPGAEKKLFDGDARVVEIPQWNVWPVIEGGNGDGLKTPRAKLLSREDEKLLFLRFNYAKYRLSPLIEAQKKRFTIARARKMFFWQHRAISVRSSIAEANLGLVLFQAKFWQKKTGTSDSNWFSELIAEGNYKLLKAIDHFDVARGFRFSTYACRAIIQGLRRMIGYARTYHKHFPCDFSFEMEKVVGNDSWLQVIQRKDLREAVRIFLAKNIAGLTKVEQKIIFEHFGFHNKNGIIRTFDEIGADIGLTRERVRQKQSIALEKLFKSLTKKRWQKARD